MSPDPTPYTSVYKTNTELLLWDIERNTRAQLDELRKLNKFVNSLKIPAWLLKS